MSKICHLVKTGVLHVGAHIGEERFLYKNHNVVWIEPIKECFEILQKNISNLPNQRAILGAIGEVNRIRDLHISEQKDRSSLYGFTEHHTREKKFKKLKSVKVETWRLDDLIQRHEINLEDVDCLVTDCQGGDLEIIKSLGDYLKHFRYVQCEVMTRKIYQNIPLEPEITRYMRQMGFDHINPNDPYQVRKSQRDNVYKNKLND